MDHIDVTHAREPHSSIRSAVRRIDPKGKLPTKARLDLCRRLLAGDPSALTETGWGPIFCGMTPDERHYRISALYMRMMPSKRRQQLAAYFTPPHLCNHIFDRLERHGYDIIRHRLLDPACGGAAFLVPAARRLRDYLKARGNNAQDILDQARSLLTGVEIESGLAELSEMLLRDVFCSEFTNSGAESLSIVYRGNGLKIQGNEQFDVVISNPPYGRVFRASKVNMARWQSVITEGHVNTYSLFIACALEQTRPGGLVAVIVPTSFISGPYFSRLREHILATAEVLEINTIEKRSEVFLDVVQDTCVLIMRKCETVAGRRGQPPATMMVTPLQSQLIGHVDIPVSGGRAWALPSVSENEELPIFDDRLGDLWEWGYQVRSGYFVWNRSRQRLAERTTPLVGEVPLVWADNVEANALIEIKAPTKRAADGNLTSFVTLPPRSSAVVTQPAIVLQRTTNRYQKRRLVAGLVGQETIDRFGGFVTENHTLVVLPRTNVAPAIPIEVVMRLLNSSVLDTQYRRLSGTVSVSAKVLQRMGLPPAATLLRHLDSGEDEDTALRLAYREAVSDCATTITRFL